MATDASCLEWGGGEICKDITLWVGKHALPRGKASATQRSLLTPMLVNLLVQACVNPHSKIGSRKGVRMWQPSLLPNLPFPRFYLFFPTQLLPCSAPPLSVLHFALPAPILPSPKCGKPSCWGFFSTVFCLLPSAFYDCLVSYWQPGQ